MKIVYRAMRLLVLVVVFRNVLCKDEFLNQNNVYMKELTSNEGQGSAINSYNSNVIPNNANSQSISSVNVQYSIGEDSTETTNYDRMDRGRIRKIYRIKNPFQQPEAEEEEASKQSENVNLHDSDYGASNQYAGMQYSLPPEEFLHQTRTENHYHQPQQQQVSTPPTSFDYTATPQPPYQYSTISTANFNNGNQQNTPMPNLESKNPSQVYNPNLHNYHYNNAYSFGIDVIQSTPSSVTLYLSTNSPNNQYVGTPSTNYVSSSAPIYQSSPSNLQPYLSSTLTNFQTGSANYNNLNSHSTVVESNSFNYVDNNRESDQNVRVNQHDNSANGIHYPINTQQQYHNDFPSSTPIPTSSTLSDINRESWQNSMHYSLNSVPISRQEYLQIPQQSLLEHRQQDTSRDPNIDNQNTDTHRIGSMPSANNVILSFARPEHQHYSIQKNDRGIDQQQNKQTDVYSHGDYGWKIDGRKAIIKNDVQSTLSQPKQQSYNFPADSNYFSSSNRYLDNGKVFDYEQVSKLNSEKLDVQEFVKAAAKAHENMKKQQQIFNSYTHQTRYLPDTLVDSESSNVAYRSNNNNNNNNQNSFINGNPSSNIGPYDLITAPPHYYTNSRDNTMDNKLKQVMDDKGLQNFIKNELPSVTPDINSQMRLNSGMELKTAYNSSSFIKDINEQNFRQNLKPFSETYYNDKNMIYNYNVRTNPGEKSPPGNSNPMEGNYEKQKQYEMQYNVNNLNSKPHSNLIVSPLNYLAQPTLNNVQPQHNTQQFGMPRPQNQLNADGVTNLKLNDIPYWLTQSLNTGNIQLHNPIENGIISTTSPLMLNQNIDSHQLDVAESILNKLIRDKPVEINSRPEYSSHSGTLLPAINNLKVVNPYNLDIRLLSEILKGRTSFNDINASFIKQFNQPHPLRWDTSQLQPLMLKNDNIGNLAVTHDGTVSPYLEINSGNRFPYQSVKYSRSQEEEESLVPITDSTHTHQIGAVIEQDDVPNENREASNSDVAGSSDEDFSDEIDDEQLKQYSGHRIETSRHKQPNSLTADAHYSYHRIFPKMVREPSPLLKPPPFNTLNSRNRKNLEQVNRRQRANKVKFSRIVKREPLFEKEDFAKDVQLTVPTLLRPPPPAAEDKSDVTQLKDN